jgi:hypothetical protein
MPKEAAAGSS